MKTILVLMSLLLISSSVESQTPVESQKLVSDKSHVVTYDRKGDVAIFTLEAISDFTDETSGEHTFPLLDFAGIIVDVNSNNKVDRNIDIAYRMKSNPKGICSQYLYEVNVSSECGVFRSSATLDIKFAGSPNEPRAHPIYRFTIPMKEIFGSRSTVGIGFEFWSSGVGLTAYPGPIDEWQSLKKTIALTQ
jgi:hypothetical protein